MGFSDSSFKVFEVSVTLSSVPASIWNDSGQHLYTINCHCENFFSITIWQEYNFHVLLHTKNTFCFHMQYVLFKHCNKGKLGHFTICKANTCRNRSWIPCSCEVIKHDVNKWRLIPKHLSDTLKKSYLWVRPLAKNWDLATIFDMLYSGGILIMQHKHCYIWFSSSLPPISLVNVFSHIFTSHEHEMKGINPQISTECSLLTLHKCNFVWEFF